MSNLLDPESMTPAERIAEAARILGRGVARLKGKRNQPTGAQEARRSLPKAARRAESRKDSASKSHLLPRTRQSEVCSAQAGMGNRTPVSETGGPPAQ